jgi:hypothetical protein
LPVVALLFAGAAACGAANAGAGLAVLVGEGWVSHRGFQIG